MWAVVQDRPSAPGKAASSGFAAQLSRATQAAQADQAGGGELKAAYDRLSAASKAVLNRLKAGEANVSKEEWAALRRELRDAGLITQEEFFRSDPDVVVVGYTDANGELVTYPPVCCQGAAQSNGGVLISRYWSPEDWRATRFGFWTNGWRPSGSGRMKWTPSTGRTGRNMTRPTSQNRLRPTRRYRAW